MPVEQEVRGKDSVTLSVPLTLAQHVTANEENVYEVNLNFREPVREPRDMVFGTTIPLKIKCVAAKQWVITDVKNYKLAIKLHEQQLQLGSLDDCIRVVRENNANEAKSIERLQRKNWVPAQVPGVSAWTSVGKFSKKRVHPFSLVSLHNILKN